MNDGEGPALARAAEARDAIQRIVASVADGVWDLAAAFDEGDRDPLMGRVFAVKVFEAVPGIGKVRARRTMESVGLAAGITLAAVPPDAREAVAAAFAGGWPSASSNP
jgi:S13-like H2TH domain